MEEIITLVKNLVADINTKVQNEVEAATATVIAEVRDNVVGPAVTNINNAMQALATKAELTDYAKKSDVKAYDDSEIKTAVGSLQTVTSTLASSKANQSDLSALEVRIQALEDAINTPKESEEP